MKILKADRSINPLNSDWTLIVAAAGFDSGFDVGLAVDAVVDLEVEAAFDILIAVDIGGEMGEDGEKVVAVAAGTDSRGRLNMAVEVAGLLGDSDCKNHWDTRFFAAVVAVGMGLGIGIGKLAVSVDCESLQLKLLLVTD